MELNIFQLVFPVSGSGCGESDATLSREFVEMITAVCDELSASQLVVYDYFLHDNLRIMMVHVDH